jgi:hypothetical protein
MEISQLSLFCNLEVGLHRIAANKLAEPAGKELALLAD